MTDPPWDRVLDEIASAGYSATELGPYGYLPTSFELLSGALERAGLSLAAGFVMVAFEDRQMHDQIEQNARRVAELLVAGGAQTLILIDALAPERGRTAGRSEAAGRLDDDAWQALVEGVTRVAEVAASAGLAVAVHPHVGTYIEFEDEVDRLLGALSPDLVGLCLDTGHTTYAGIDPVQLLDRYAGRLAYVHLKDVDVTRLERARADGQSFLEAVTAGIFRPLGEGSVDFPAVAARLEHVGYSDWATVEQDRLPDSSATPVEEASQSLRYLTEIGLAASSPTNR
jgi:inosose dehydratase